MALATDATADLLAQLKVAPPWSEIDSSQESKIKAQSLMDVLINIARNLTTDQCRELVEKDMALIEQVRRVNGPVYLNELSKLFILNRVYFKVPEWDAPEAMRYRGGWLPAAPSKDGKYPSKEGKYGILFPVEMESDGTLKLSHGGYSYYGGGYFPLKEFNLFQERYGARWGDKLKP